MKQVLTVLLLVLPLISHARGNQQNRCEELFVSLARDFFVQSGHQEEIEQYLAAETERDEGAKVAHSLQLDSMKLIAVKDIDPGAYFVRRSVAIQANFQESSPLKVELYFLTEGSFECSSEEVLDYTGFRLLPL